MLVAVNPALDTTSYPSVVTGDTWTSFYGIVSGLSGSTGCRIAFRYFVTDGGENGVNGSTIGIDDFKVISAVNSVGINTLETHISVYPNPVAEVLTVSLDQHVNAILRFTDMQGKILFSQPMTSDKATLNVSALSAGNYVVQLFDQASKKHFSQVVVVQ